MPEITTCIAELGGPCEVLQCLAAPSAAPGEPVTLLLLDRAGNNLIELDWAPQLSLVARSQRLTEQVPPLLTSASVAGRRLCLTGSKDEVLLVDRDSGAVDRLSLQGPACLLPDGRALVVATERGLLSYRMWPRADGSSSLPGRPEPLLVADLHAAGALFVLPSAVPDAIELAVGGFAHVALVQLRDLGGTQPRGGVDIVYPKGLPAEDVALVLPPPPFTLVERRLLYLTDMTRYALGVIDTDSLDSIACPLGSGSYGRLHRLVPALDGSSCRIALRGGTTLDWRPGAEPMAAPFPPGLLTHHGAIDLVLDPATGRVAEVERA